MKYTITLEQYINVCGSSRHQEFELVDSVSGSPVIANIIDTIRNSIQFVKPNLVKSVSKKISRNLHQITLDQDFAESCDNKNSTYKFEYSAEDKIIHVAISDSESDADISWYINEYDDDHPLYFIPVAEFTTPYKYNYTVTKLLSDADFATFDEASSCVRQFLDLPQTKSPEVAETLIKACVRIYSKAVFQSEWYELNRKLVTVLKDDPDSWFRYCGYAAEHQLYELEHRYSPAEACEPTV